MLMALMTNYCEDGWAADTVLLSELIEVCALSRSNSDGLNVSIGELRSDGPFLWFGFLWSQVWLGDFNVNGGLPGSIVRLVSTLERSSRLSFNEGIGGYRLVSEGCFLAE